ncbi:hypothetical protein E2P81_ATG09273 [Venturia nashicola]|uniref:Uncharacterized protein n=1 Tax=Venturia nashicola TaxID=86259 RepID=A0A4Z1NIQ4_9PEZI|nr:hypothetical protein E6O75_ATG09478 [Venturia nashicola]TLD20203.1 hypothetical protein E2P81_ATG09273 [Venturia nashicola]
MAGLQDQDQDQDRDGRMETALVSCCTCCTCSTNTSGDEADREQQMQKEMRIEQAAGGRQRLKCGRWTGHRSVVKTAMVWGRCGYCRRRDSMDCGFSVDGRGGGVGEELGRRQLREQAGVVDISGIGQHQQAGSKDCSSGSSEIWGVSAASSDLEETSNVGEEARKLAFAWAWGEADPYTGST